jgi:glutamate formiminotransferase/formiminotetrahydrofolate cyclodeaminase
MAKLVECVPNFSEGRDRAIIDSITAEIDGVDGAALLDVDPGAATNRTVVTFVGSPDAAVEAAFRAIKRASELIDMSKHQGAHARMGATDVCPFVPVSDMTMTECVELAHRLGKRVGEELGIPVYLYEEAATRPERRSLADVRTGEYEGLADKLADPEWKPDYGPSELKPRSGATVIGAREFLIAYNFNLNTRERKLAHRIALRVREKGRAKRDENGKMLKDENGSIVRTPGTLKSVRAVGWYIEEYGCAQISMNLTNYKVTPVHKAFDEVCRQANEFGLRVTGSELVGLIPREAILEAGRHYLRKQGKTIGVPEKELIHVAVVSLGLSDISPFNPDEKIIEYIIKPKEPQLVDQTVSDFTDEVSINSPAPGGGTVAALAGALGAGLISMVGALTTEKKGFEDRFEEMEELGFESQALKDHFLMAIDEDTRAFNKVMEAGRGRPKTPEAKAEKAARVEAATKEATLVPLGVLERAARALSLAQEMAEKGNPNSLSDAGVGGLMAAAAAEGAYLNVLINLPGIPDEEWVTTVRSRAKEMIRTVRTEVGRLGRQLAERLE